MTEVNRPKVGVGLVIIKDDKILMGKRKGSHGAGEFGGPGGKMDVSESFEKTAERELAEEVGLQFKTTKFEFLCLTNLTRYLPEHYVDIAMVARWKSGEPKVMEPDKIESWEWYDIDKLPEPLFGAVANYFVALKTGQTYFTS